MSRFRNRFTGAVVDVDDSRDGSLGARWERVDSTPDPAPAPAPVLEPVDPAPVPGPSDVDGDPSPDAEGS